MSPFAFIGDKLFNAAASAGQYAVFLSRLMSELFPGLRYQRLIFEQARFVGIQSLPVVFLTSLFVGGVAALQTAYQMSGQMPLLWVGTVVSKSVFIELGPVLTALVVGARVSSSFAAEIGTMRVTEQIDAMETLAVRPIRYLAVPRLVATTLMLPVVTIIANAIAILGGMAVAVLRVGISLNMFNRGMKFLFDAQDVYGGLIKSFVFGAIIAMQGCFFGFQASGGAEGVGTATTKAVVASCVMILVMDYFLAEVVFRLIFPA
ncbi:MAG TPA: ABC transporter permease [Candidatus Eisenbacteria bacterium]|nr:ABC transporter permease [Candidatus Eisenbacteria bacterium]